VQHLAESLKAVEAQLRKLEEAMAARRPNARTVSSRLISFEHEHGVAAIDPVAVLAVEDREDGKTMVLCSAGEGQAFEYRVNYSVESMLGMLSPDEGAADVDV